MSQDEYQPFLANNAAIADAYSYGAFEMVDPGAHHLMLATFTNRVPLQWEAFELDDLRYVMGAGAYALADNILRRKFTHADVDRLKAMFASFQVSHPDVTARQPYPFDEARFRRVVDEYDGHFPVALLAVPPGTTFYVGEPYMLLFSDEPEMAQCAIYYLQARGLPYTFRPTTAATRARRRYDRMYGVMSRAYPMTAKENPELLRAMTLALIVDFGMRATLDSWLTGSAILQTWPGTDTMDAVEFAQFHLNGGKPTWANSIPASEHATIATWPRENAAIANAIAKFGNGFLSWVGDLDGYDTGIQRLTADDNVGLVRAGEGYLVTRPDSGDPIKDVLLGLGALERAFGTKRTEGGLKRCIQSGAIQGDEMSDRKAFDKGQLYETLMSLGWCPSNCAIGMGEYAHRGMRSDSSAKFMVSASGVLDVNGKLVRFRTAMKVGDNPVKLSKPGFLAWFDRDYERLVPISAQQFRQGEFGDYEVVADYRSENRFPITPRRSFDEIVRATRESWEMRAPHPTFQSICDPRIAKLQKYCMELKAQDADAPEFGLDAEELDLEAVMSESAASA